MTDALIVPVGLGARSYNIHIGPSVLADAGRLISPYAPRGRAFVVTDETVARLHLDVLTHALEASGIQAIVTILPPGEGTKSFDHLAELLNGLLSNQLERSDLLVAFGGGVIGDLAGFAASLALRGIPFVQIPTTLLAQVDSSVGGKTGINVSAGKNLVGAFHQPKAVLADTNVLNSLPVRELRAGYAEVVKYGAIDDLPFFEWLETHGKSVLEGDLAARMRAVAVSCQAKARIVAEDELETGKRALLNFGHTFGHALESATGFGARLLHGEGVSIGMVMAFDLSARLGLCDGQDAARFAQHLEALGMPTRPEFVSGMSWNADDLVARMGRDKKVKDGKLTFILAQGIGKAFVTQDVDPEDLHALLSEGIAA